MNGRDWIVALTLCRRELRGGLRGFGVFLGCLFLGVLAISAVGSLGRALEAGLAADAKAILGGDVSVSLTSRDLSDSERVHLRGLGTLSQSLSTRTMARAQREGKPSSVLVELKGGAFKPEHVGQLNFYVTLVDEHLKSEDDKPTIGLLLCKQKHRVVAEYALRGMTQPIGVAEYKLDLPADLARYLPSIEQIEAELQDDEIGEEGDVNS